MGMGLPFLCNDCEDPPTLKDFFKDNKDDVGRKFAERYHMHK